MNKKLKKLVAIVLTAAMTFSIGAPAFAAGTNYEEPSAMTATANAVEGLDQFMSYNKDMTITFDSNAALLAGYTSDAVSYVSSNIATMNQMVLAGTAMPSENFTVTTILGAQTRAVGESKIVTHWDGRVDYYLNSDEADALVEFIDVGDSIGDACIKAAKKLVNSAVLKRASTVSTIYTILLQRSLESAVSHGTGIVMTTQLDSMSGMLQVGFYYQ